MNQSDELYQSVLNNDSSIYRDQSICIVKLQFYILNDWFYP
jgi:hypothetical protein